MLINLNPDSLRMCMQMWRDALDMKIPVHDTLKVHMITRRREILGNYIGAATHWGMLLRECTADGQDQQDLETFRNEVAQFRAWAQDETEKLLSLIEK